MNHIIEWYFDFISPFSYLQSTRLDRLATHAIIKARPVLFAGLLGHWGNVGPAELPSKRIWTFEHCAWLAHRDGIELRMPAQHPFNPLPLLRLALACGEGGIVPAHVVARIYRFVWHDGWLPSNEAEFASLVRELGTNASAIEAPGVKQALRENGQRAIDAGVFGVPTAVVGGRIFWGYDASDMLEAFLRADAFFSGDGIKAARELKEGPQRARS